MKLFRAATTLVWLSFRRLLWSSGTLMVVLPLGICGMMLVLWRHFGNFDDSDRVFNEFSRLFVSYAMLAFIVPICTLAFGTASIGGDREDRTLLFLLVRPVPRWLVLLAKFAATLPLCLGIVLGSYWVFCWMAGPVGAKAWDLYLPALTATTLAYLGLYHLFAVSFRHSTILALLYSLFFEVLLGNLPGIVQRVAINAYGRAIIFAMGQPEGMKMPGRMEPISMDAALWSLLGIAAGGLALAILVFERREYRDLT